MRRRLSILLSISSEKSDKIAANSLDFFGDRSVSVPRKKGPTKWASLISKML
jgi:hypothetical protein